MKKIKKMKKVVKRDIFKTGQARDKAQGDSCFEGGEPTRLFRDGRCPLQSMGVFHTGSVS